MTQVGQRERPTQNRIVKLFTEKDKLDYIYLGNWQDRENNSNIEEEYLRKFLVRRGIDEILINKAIFELKRAAGDQSKGLFDVNKEVYTLLRYGVQVQPDVGQNNETVWLIDWKNPLNNDFY